MAKTKTGKSIKKRSTQKTAGKSGTNGVSALVIVESPAKAKTIEKYLGRGHTVRASMGHIRDLPERELGVDLEQDFAPVYHILPRRAKLITDLRKLAGQSEVVYLATDMDREGEAIAWHLACALDLPPEKTKRVVFNEITKAAVVEAFRNPRSVDMNKVDAQQARRVLDRIVGYQLSPLLWTKIARGLSAGRVQSVAVRLIVEREVEIREFIPVESWRITGSFTPRLDEAPQLVSGWQKFLEGGEDPDAGRTQKERTRWLGEHACFEADLIKADGIEFPVKTRDQAVKLAEELGFVVEEIEEHPWEEYARLNLTTVDVAGSTRLGAAEFKIASVQTRKTSGKPPGPLTTAAMQQAASGQLRFGVDHSMVERLFKLQNRGYNNSARIFSLTMLTLWCRAYGMSLR